MTREPTEREGLGSPRTAAELLDLYFLDLRSHLLEVAAGLDRIEQARGGAQALDDPRVRDLLVSLDLLREGGGDRARRFLELFSDPA